MANIFQIVPSSDAVQLDKEGRGDVTITVTNIAKAVAGRAMIVPLGDTDESWLTIEGEEERELESGIPQDVKVIVELPKDAPEGELKFRVDVISEVNPDDDFSEGSEITIVPAPPSKLWLWILLAVLFLLIVVVVAWLVVSSGKEEAPSPEEQQAALAEQEAGGDVAEQEAAAQRYMPNLMGLSLEEAQRQVEALGLTLEIEDDLLSSEGLTVSSQTPRPGQSIGEEGSITLELAAEMPDLIGQEGMEATFTLLESGMSLGEIKYRISDRQEAGKVLSQSIVPQVETKAGTPVDLVLSLGACQWTPQFAQGFGPVSCRSGSAISGLYCGNKNCGIWQLYCCPYLPTADLDAELTKSDWIPPTGTIANRKGSFFDGLQCRGSGCPQMRARYLRSPHLKKSSNCRSFKGKSFKPERCGDGQYVAEFACLSGKTCNEWQMTCCPGESIPPE